MDYLKPRLCWWCRLSVSTAHCHTGAQGHGPEVYDDLGMPEHDKPVRPRIPPELSSARLSCTHYRRGTAQSAGPSTAELT